MFKFFANIFGYVLNFIYNFVNNYGIAIILFTILLRLILLPMNWKQQKTMKKSARIQQKMKEIQDKYSNDIVRMNEEVRNLYATEKMSPFSGCLGSILQLVVVISMFILVSNPLTYMKQLPEEKIKNYQEQLSEEGKSSNYIEIAIIKNLADKEEEVNINMDFLGLDLSDVPSGNLSNPKVYIIPILYVMTSFISMKLTTSMTSSKKKKEVIDEKENEELKKQGKLVKVDDKNEEIDTMESMNKTMTYMMPIMTVSIAFIAPLGLALYWFISNLLMILERIAVNKFVKEEE